MSQSQPDFVKESNDLKNNSSNDMPESAQNAILDRFVYYKYAYDTGTEPDATTSTMRSTGTDDSGQPNKALADETNDFQNSITDYQSQDKDFAAIPEDTPPVRKPLELPFVRSEYSSAK